MFLSRNVKHIHLNDLLVSKKENNIHWDRSVSNGSFKKKN